MKKYIAKSDEMKSVQIENVQNQEYPKSQEYPKFCSKSEFPVTLQKTADEAISKPSHILKANNSRIPAH